MITYFSLLCGNILSEINSNNLNLTYDEQHYLFLQDEVLRSLRGTLRYLFTRDNILGSNVPGRVYFQNDNYRMSLLEQEICKRKSLVQFNSF